LVVRRGASPRNLKPGAGHPRRSKNRLAEECVEGSAHHLDDTTHQVEPNEKIQRVPVSLPPSYTITITRDTTCRGRGPEWDHGRGGEQRSVRQQLSPGQRSGALA
jgi:hypothetical protein